MCKIGKTNQGDHPHLYFTCLNIRLDNLEGILPQLITYEDHKSRWTAFAVLQTLEIILDIWEEKVLWVEIKCYIVSIMIHIAKFSLFIWILLGQPIHDWFTLY